MRDIKFRGKTYSGEWVIGNYSVSSFHYDLDNPGRKIHSIMTENALHNIDPETLGQYIEQHSKDGDDIYEGDVVESKDVIIFCLNEYITECKACVYGHGVVEWNSPNFRIKRLNGSEFYDPMGDRFEWSELRVIGNMWDNPELLKGE